MEIDILLNQSHDIIEWKRVVIYSLFFLGVIIKYLDGLEEDELYDDEKEFEVVIVFSDSVI